MPLTPRDSHVELACCDEERRLQKLDILREAEGEDAAGEAGEAAPESGLHLADPKSGMEALGECEEVGFELSLKGTM